MSGRHTSRLAASFNATLARSQVQGLLDGASISSMKVCQVLYLKGQTSYWMMWQPTVVRWIMMMVKAQFAQKILTIHINIGTPNLPPGIPNPAVN